MRPNRDPMLLTLWSLTGAALTASTVAWALLVAHAARGTQGLPGSLRSLPGRAALTLLPLVLGLVLYFWARRRLLSAHWSQAQMEPVGRLLQAPGWVWGAVAVLVLGGVAAALGHMAAAVSLLAYSVFFAMVQSQNRALFPPGAKTAPVAMFPVRTER